MSGFVAKTMHSVSDTFASDGAREKAETRVRFWARELNVNHYEAYVKAYQCRRIVPRLCALARRMS